MNREERTEAIMGAVSDWCDEMIGGMSLKHEKEAEKKARKVIALTFSEERERCAKVADDNCDMEQCGECVQCGIAAAIREDG